MYPSIKIDKQLISVLDIERVSACDRVIMTTPAEMMLQQARNMLPFQKAELEAGVLELQSDLEALRRKKERVVEHNRACSVAFANGNGKKTEEELLRSILMVEHYTVCYAFLEEQFNLYKWMVEAFCKNWQIYKIYDINNE